MASWLSGWAYRRPVRIDNTGNSNNLTNYQVLVTVDTASLISAGKMRPDCGDIRFTDIDGVTILPYWIESGVNTTTTKIWVKVPSIPALSVYTIYMYYGNPNATSLSDPVNTLLIYEDWSSGTLNGWTMHTKGGYSASIVTNEGNPPPAVKISGDAPSGGDQNHFIYKTINKPAGIGLRIIADHAGHHDFYTSNVYTRYFIYKTDNTFVAYYDYSGDANDKWIYNDQWLVTDSTTLSLTTLWVGFGLSDGWDANYNQNARFDNIRVMLYTSPEPTTTIDPEEVAPAPAPPPAWLGTIDELKKRLIFTTTPSFLSLSGSGSLNILSPSAGTKTLTVRNWWLITNATDGRITLASPSKLFGSLLAKKQKKTGQEDIWTTLGMGEPILLYYQGITPDSKVLVLVSWRED